MYLFFIEKQMYLYKIYYTWIQVCGNLDCCLTPWLTGNFDEGAVDYYEGPSQLGECANFEFYEGNDGHDISMTIFHQGFVYILSAVCLHFYWVCLPFLFRTDGACFEYIYIDTKNINGTSSYLCEFDGFTFIDDNDYLHSERCYQN